MDMFLKINDESLRFTILYTISEFWRDGVCPAPWYLLVDESDDFKNPCLCSFSLAGIYGYVETKDLISGFTWCVVFIFYQTLYFVLEDS